MENKEGVNVMKFGGAPEGFMVAARVVEFEVPTMAALQPVNLGTPNPELKKKRGRPRKYSGPEGGTMTAALSPMPISASIPLSSGGDFSGWKQLPATKLKPFHPVKKPHKLDFQSVGNQQAFLVGANFTTHVITVNAEEDVAMKILSFSQQDCAICVLSASGSISNVTLRQPNSSGGTLTYEGRFEILSLSGSFMPTDNGILKSRSGGMSVSLAGPDGRVIGGGLAGLLIAATPVQLVLGSFMVGQQLDPKLKKQKIEPHSAPGLAPAPITTFISPFNREATELGGGSYGGQNLSFSSPPLNHTDPMTSLHSPQDSKDVDTDNLTSSSPEGESNEDSPSRFEISG